MNCLSILEDKGENKYLPLIDQEIGYGADGQVFTLRDYPNKVLKFSILYDLDYSHTLDIKYANISKMFAHIKSTVGCFPFLYDYGMLLSGNRKTTVGNQDYIIYYSIWEKLNKLSDDNKKVLFTILNAFDNNSSIRSLKKDLDTLSMYLDFEIEKSITFFKELNNLKINHNDLHIRNILIDNNGYFKLIDFDKSTFKENTK